MTASSLPARPFMAILLWFSIISQFLSLTFADRVVNGSLLEYQFLRDECLKNTFINLYEGSTNSSTDEDSAYVTTGSVGSLSFNNRTLGSNCLRHNGVYATRLSDYSSSARNVSAFKKAMQSSTYTMEFWMITNSSATKASTILSISNTATKTSCYDYFKVSLIQLFIYCL